MAEVVTEAVVVVVAVELVVGGGTANLVSPLPERPANAIIICCCCWCGCWKAGGGGGRGRGWSGAPPFIGSEGAA